jgi:hypothetical protein
MPRSTLNERGQAMMDMVPPVLWDVPLYHAVYDSLGDQYEMLHDAIDLLHKNTIPYSAEEYLSLFEAQLGLTIEPEGLTLEQRKEIVTTFMQRAVLDGSGLDWIAAADRLIEGIWVYETHETGDAGSPPAHVIIVRLPYTSGSIMAQIAEVLLRSITPAATQINVVYNEGWLLDVSQLDNDLLS